MRVPRFGLKAGFFQPGFDHGIGLRGVVGWGKHIEGIETNPLAEILIGEWNILDVGAGERKHSHDRFSDNAPRANQANDRPADRLDHANEFFERGRFPMFGEGAKCIFEANGAEVRLPVALVNPKSDATTGGDFLAKAEHPALGIGSVLHHSDGIDGIERAISEGQGEEGRLDAMEFGVSVEVGSAGIDRRAEVEGDHLCAIGEGDLGESAGATAAVEDDRACEGGLRPLGDPVKTFSRKVGAVLGVELEPSIFVPLQTEGVRIVLGFDEAGNGVHDGEAL